MTPLQMAVTALAGVAAGTINTVVGSGTLITFPTLLALGFAPITANVSNTVGLAPGSASGAFGYRRELAGQRGRLVRLGSASLLGGIVGGVLLLVLPADAFQAVVPALIGLGIVLVVVQPRVSRWTARRASRRGELAGGAADGAADGAAAGAAAGAADRAADRRQDVEPRTTYGALLLWVAVFATGVYGGYFGAAQGVLLMGILGIALQESMQRNNATKNVLAGLVNGVAAVLFIVHGGVDWPAAILLAVGSTIGGQLGARVGRWMPPVLLRTVIVVVGLVAIVAFLR